MFQARYWFGVLLQLFKDNSGVILSTLDVYFQALAKNPGVTTLWSQEDFVKMKESEDPMKNLKGMRWVLRVEKGLMALKRILELELTAFQWQLRLLTEPGYFIFRIPSYGKINQALFKLVASNIQYTKLWGVSQAIDA